DACLLFLLGAALVFPLFGLKYPKQWESIESTFIADARMQLENWGHHLWQPLWYSGTRTDYIYPPALRYGVAIVSGVFHASPARSYHFLIGIFYAFGIASVYLWTRTASGSRVAGWLAAIGAALLSPCFLVLPDIRSDSYFLAPMRLHVLMRYGEGPHISALSILPIAWLGAWRRFEGGGVRWLLLCASAAALVVTFNFYGAVTLAITFPLLAWAFFLERHDWRVLRDTAFIAALAYGLTAWWLAPSYFRITVRNLRFVSPGSDQRSLTIAAILALAYLALSFGLVRRLRFSPYSWFIWSGLWLLSVYILGSRWFGLQITGVPQRLLPELDLFAILCGVQIVRGIWTWRPASPVRSVLRPAAALLLLLCFWPSWSYLRHVFVEFPRDRQWQNRIEYRTAAWLEKNAPNQRVFLRGSIRLWYNVWQNGQQADGGSEQGLLNPRFPNVRWRAEYDPDPVFVRHWLQAVGVDVLVASGPASQEPNKDFAQQMPMFDAHLPLLRDDGEGNRFYRVPRRATGIARLVDRSRVETLPTVPTEYEQAPLAAYVDAVEASPPGGDSPDRARARWLSSDALDVDIDAQAGEALLVQENYDPYWRAYVDGRRLAIKPDAIGYMLVDAPPGKHTVRLVFETPLELIAGRALTLATLALVVFLALRYRRGNPGNFPQSGVV
ncbi:MAG: hypothetical protein LAP38_21985, partial [Acidobacteriia bacterium]|nr:hypothetical protein [Terriglobia bacterium]